MHPTVMSKKILEDSNLDYVVRGEADYTFLELIDRLNKNQSVKNIDGLAFKIKGKIYVNEKKKFIENLDELPFPARDLLPIKNYFEAGLSHGFVLENKKNMNIITSRGCPGRCVFCSVHLIWGRKFRKRSPENVLSEIEHLKKTYEIKHIQFEDDNLTFDKERAKKIFQGMIDKKLNLKWNTPNGVAAYTLDEKTLSLMKKAGCYMVKFGIESGDEIVLKKIIHKPQNLKNIEKLIKHCKKIGLEVGAFFVIGFPEETKEQIQKSFDFPYKAGLNYVEYSMATPHYATELYETCKKNNQLKENFNAGGLYARSCNIKSKNFTPEWIEKKTRKEFFRFVFYLMFFKPHIFLKNLKNYFLTNPKFVINFLGKSFS